MNSTVMNAVLFPIGGGNRAKYSATRDRVKKKKLKRRKQENYTSFASYFRLMFSFFFRNMGRSFNWIGCDLFRMLIKRLLIILQSLAISIDAWRFAYTRRLELHRSLLVWMATRPPRGPREGGIHFKNDTIQGWSTFSSASRIFIRISNLCSFKHQLNSSIAGRVRSLYFIPAGKYCASLSLSMNFI